MPQLSHRTRRVRAAVLLAAALGLAACSGSGNGGAAGTPPATMPRLPPGQHVVQVEFAAADHVPFDPRVLTRSAFRVAE
jgi:hypothetical protein